MNNDYVDYATGAVNYSIPITEISEGSITIPISLIYYSKGVKVEDIASWVGLGWNLNVGGVINRSVIGHPDDMNDEEIGVGILHSDALTKIDNLNLNDTETILSDIVSKLHTEKKDTQPDIFTLSLLGKQVSFIFDKENKISLIGNHNIKLNYSLDTNGKIKSFNLIDENNTSYTFNEYDITTEITTYFSFNGNQAHMPSDEEKTLVYNSSWYLTKISYLSNEINITYSSEDIEFERKKLEVAQICKSYDCQTYPTAQGNSIPIKNSKVKIKTKRIETITSSNETITFFKNSRMDLKGSSKLDNIRKTTLLNGFYTDYKLNYTYSTSPGTPVENSYIYKRLQLESLKFNNENTFNFLYEETVLPNRESTEQDFWGYYNGSNSTTLIPTTYVYPDSQGQKTSFYPLTNNGQEFIISGENRTSNLTYAKSGVLKEIKTQLGGVVNFEYELNDFYYNNYYLKGNGIRVKSVIINDNNTNSYIKNYSYLSDSNMSSGIVSLVPSFSYYNEFRNIRYIYDQTVYDETPNSKYRLQTKTVSGLPYPIPLITNLGSSNWSTSDKHYYSTLRFSTPLNSNISSDYSVYYTKISKSFLQEKTVYEYLINSPSSEFPLNPELNENSIRRVRTPGDINNNWGQDPQITQINNPNYYDSSYPYIPKLSINWKLTSLKKIKNFVDNTIIKEVVYDYEKVSKYSSIKSVFGLKYGFFESPNYIYISALQAVEKVYRKSVICFSKYPFLINTNKLLKSKKTIFYESGSSIEQTENLTYNHLGLITEKEKIIGDKEYKTSYKYPGDLVSQPIEYMYNLVNENRVSEVIEQKEYLNNEFLGRKYTEYNSFTSNNFILPNKTKFYNKENALIKTSVISKYDDIGGPIENYEEKSLVYSSNIMGHNSQFVIAEATNAKHSEVYHTSFEDNGGIVPLAIENSYTGEKFMKNLFTVPFVMPNSKQYVISYWKVNINNKWEFSGYLPYVNNMVIQENTFDEVRVHPVDSKMVTTTYHLFFKKPLTKADERGNVIRYTYDSAGRSKLILDKNHKVVKKYNYNFKN